MDLTETVVYLKNRSPMTAVATTPYELWHGVKPNLSHLRIIGSTAYVHVPKEKRVKLDINTHKGIMIGYGGGTNQYKVWDLTRKDIVVLRDVVFIEEKPIEQTPAVYVEEPRIIHDSTMDTSGPLAEAQELKIIHNSVTVLPEIPEPEPVDPGILLQESTMTIERQEQATDGLTQRASARLTKGVIASTRFEDENFDKQPQVRMAKLARNIDPNDEDEPTTVQEAINHPIRGKQWEKAIQDEVNSLIKNHTWDLIPRPQNRQIVTNKFAFKHKKDERTIIVKLKARLVARGFSQIYGVNYLDTYAPVVSSHRSESYSQSQQFLAWKSIRWTWSRHSWQGIWKKKSTWNNWKDSKSEARRTISYVDSGKASTV